MPGLDGFGVLKKLVERKARVPHVVFATRLRSLRRASIRRQRRRLRIKGRSTNLASPKLSHAHAEKWKRTPVLPSASKNLSTSLPLQSPRPLLRRCEIARKSQQASAASRCGRFGFRNNHGRPHLRLRARTDGTSNYSTLEEMHAALDADVFWRPPPLLPRQHPSHQGSRAWVQIQLHAENERQKTNRSPRLPPTNQAPPRTV